MRLYLTSSPCHGYAGDINEANGFLEELKENLPTPLNCLMITSAPDDQVMTDRMAWELREIFERCVRPFDHYEVCDRRTQDGIVGMLERANFVILCGGHVPTQNKFFKDLRLRQRIRKHLPCLTIMSISAGSMNCADRVYSSPELEGEAIDKNYKRFMTGLGLTNINILPHYETLYGCKIDGLDLITDIIRKDSYKTPVWCLDDGCYFIITEDSTELRGDAWVMNRGKMRHVTNFSKGS